MRGRNNNNNNNGGGSGRKGPNPLTRSYESNGPDVKIRGTAQHVGEKYLQLARDAQTSGDPVAAEAYLQHAEHYFRIIAAAQQAQQQAQPGFVRQPGDVDLDEGDDDEDLILSDRFSSPSERIVQPPAPVVAQPYPERQPYNGGGQEQRANGYNDRNERSDGQDRGYRQDRYPPYERDNRQDRQPNQDRPSNQDRAQGQDRQPYQGQPQQQGQDRPQYDRNNGQRFDRNDRNNRPRYPRDGQGDQQRDSRDNRGDLQFREQPRVAAPREAQPTFGGDTDAGPELPAFITAPVRLGSQIDDDAANTAPALESPTPAVDRGGEAPGESYAVRPRRRRRPRVAMDAEGESGGAEGDFGGPSEA